MADQNNADCIQACIDAVARTLGNGEFIIRIEMGALIPGRNAQYPFLVTVGRLNDTGQSTGQNRAVVLAVTTNTPHEVYVRSDLDLSLGWKPL